MKRKIKNIKTGILFMVMPYISNVDAHLVNSSYNYDNTININEKVEKSFFEKAWVNTLNKEGGYQCNELDKGNYNSVGKLIGTNYGISAPVLEQYLGYPPTKNDMVSLSKNTARYIGKKYYWDKFKLEKISNEELAVHIFDLIFTLPYGNQKMIIKTVNKISDKEIINWDECLSFINKHKDDKDKIIKLNNLLVMNRINRYNNNSIFYKGWITRAKSFKIG